MTIQKEGRQKRANAEAELNRIEKQLNEKLVSYDLANDVTKQDEQTK